MNCILPAIYVAFTCRRDIFILDQPTLNCSLPASYVVFPCRRDVFFSESPTLNCMLHYVCILPHAFGMTFSNVRLAFVSVCWLEIKKGPLSGLTSHKCATPALAARSVVFICRHDVVLPESPPLTCMLYFAALKLPCRSKIKGRGCCPPQRAFNEYGQPLAGLSRVKRTTPNSVCRSRNPYLLPRSEACGHRAFRRARVHPTPSNLRKPPFGGKIHFPCILQ